MGLQDAAAESNDGSNNSILSYPVIFLRPMLAMNGTVEPVVTLHKALVLDGTTLEFALQPRCQKLFLEIASRCQAVICCRATPLQKVRLRTVFHTTCASLNATSGCFQIVTFKWLDSFHYDSLTVFLWNVIQVHVTIVVYYQ